MDEKAGAVQNLLTKGSMNHLKHQLKHLNNILRNCSNNSIAKEN
jgi:hypothetical protein